MTTAAQLLENGQLAGLNIWWRLRAADSEEEAAAFSKNVEDLEELLTAMRVSFDIARDTGNIIFLTVHSEVVSRVQAELRNAMWTGEIKIVPHRLMHHAL